MNRIAPRFLVIPILLSLALTPVLLSGCGGDPDQRKSGTLVVPLESVEKAGEASGKAEDARKGARKASAPR